METVGLIVLVVALAAAALVFAARQSKEKGRWGIGKLSRACPRCGAKLPIIRKPASRDEMLWGGWTCPKCGCKVDKYGGERST